MTTSTMHPALVHPVHDLPGDVAAAGLALAGGMAIAWLDVRVTEVVVSIVPLLLFTVTLGFAQPRHAWRWGLLVAIWIPIAHWTGLPGVPREPSSNAAGPLLALVPAVLGALAGAGLRALTRLMGPIVR